MADDSRFLAGDEEGDHAVKSGAVVKIANGAIARTGSEQSLARKTLADSRFKLGLELDVKNRNASAGFIDRMGEQAFMHKVAKHPLYMSGVGGDSVDPLLLLDNPNFSLAAEGTEKVALLENEHFRSPVLGSPVSDYIANSPVLLQGFLKRWTAGLPKRQVTRYFQVSGHYLHYSKDKKMQRIEKELKYIDLDLCTAITAHGSTIVIRMSHTKLALLLKAASHELAEAWISGLESAMASNTVSCDRHKIKAIEKMDWMPVDTDHKDFNWYCHSLGLTKRWEWVDIGTCTEKLIEAKWKEPATDRDEVPLLSSTLFANRSSLSQSANRLNTCTAVALRYKHDDEKLQYLKYFREGQAMKNHSESSSSLRRVTEKLFFMEQLGDYKTTATIAAVHSIANNLEDLSVQTGSPLEQFICSAAPLASSRERGLALSEALPITYIPQKKDSTLADAADARAKKAASKAMNRSLAVDKAARKMAGRLSMLTGKLGDKKGKKPGLMALVEEADAKESEEAPSTGDETSTQDAETASDSTKVEKKEDGTDWIVFLKATTDDGTELLYELDGTQGVPICHGPVTDGDLISSAARCIQMWIELSDDGSSDSPHARTLGGGHASMRHIFSVDPDVLQNPNSPKKDDIHQLDFPILALINTGGDAGIAALSTVNDPEEQAIKQEEAAGFVAAAQFAGSKPGFVFKFGSLGLGYYVDNAAPAVAPPAPEPAPMLGAPTPVEAAVEQQHPEAAEEAAGAAKEAEFVVDTVDCTTINYTKVRNADFEQKRAQHYEIDMAAVKQGAQDSAAEAKAAAAASERPEAKTPDVVIMSDDGQSFFV